MGLKSQIKKVNEEIVKLLISRSFTITDVNKYLVIIQMNDLDMRFAFWIRNGWEYFKCYEGFFNSMDIKFTDTEKQSLYLYFIKIKNSAEVEELRQRRININNKLKELTK